MPRKNSRSFQMAKSHEGFVFFDRKLGDHPLRTDHVAWAVFTVLMSKAAYQAYDHVAGVRIQPGELLISQRKFADHLGISLKQLRGALTRLEKCGELKKTRAHERAHERAHDRSDPGTILTLVYWSVYQSRPNPKKRSEGTRKGTRKGTQEKEPLDNNENRKKSRVRGRQAACRDDADSEADRRQAILSELRAHFDGLADSPPDDSKQAG